MQQQITVDAQLKFENQTTPITNRAIYTAGLTDEILRLSEYCEGDTPTFTFTHDIGQKTISPGNEFFASTIKVKAGTSIFLTTDTGAIPFSLYITIEKLWNL